MKIKLTKKTIANCEDPTMKSILQTLWDLKKSTRDLKKAINNKKLLHD